MLDLATEFGARADRRLRAEEIAWFVTVRPDGTPIPVPVWFVWDGETILLYSQPRAGKVRNIAANPRVSLHLDTDAHGDDMIVVTGEARVDPSAPAMHVLPAYAEKYRARVDAAFGGRFAEVATDYSTPIRIVPGSHLGVLTRRAHAPRDGRDRGPQVAITNPDKVFFRARATRSSTSSRYYLAVADGALRGAGGRPMALKRYVDGADGRVLLPEACARVAARLGRDVELSFPSGRTAHEIVVRDAAQLAWIVNLGCIDLNPHPVRADDLDHPDELRVDLDPVPGVAVGRVRRVALLVREVLGDHGLAGWPKTSGSRGHPRQRARSRRGGRSARCARPPWRWRARSSGAPRSSPRASGGRRSGTASSSTTTRTRRTGPWPRRTRCGPRPTHASLRPLTWDEVPRCRPGRLHAGDRAGALRPARGRGRRDRRGGGLTRVLLELSARQRAEGLGDAPWPPHYAKARRRAAAGACRRGGG